MSTSAGKRFASIWDAIEPTAEAAASMRLRAEIANAIIEEVRRRALTQAATAQLCAITQPRVSDLVRGRLDLFSLDTLVDIAARLGLRTNVTVRRARTG